MSKSIVLAGALALSALAGQALAADPVATRVVSTAGVDFRDPAAVQALYHRIYRAADTACHMAMSDRRCIRDAVSDAVARTDRPLLTAMYKSNYGDKGLGRSGPAYATDATP